jgi:hypothetical protein
VIDLANEYWGNSDQQLSRASDVSQAMTDMGRRREAVKIGYSEKSQIIDKLSKSYYQRRLERDAAMRAAGNTMKSAGRGLIDYTKSMSKYLTNKRLGYLAIGAAASAITIGLIDEIHDSVSSNNTQRDHNVYNDNSDFGSPVNLDKVLTRGRQYLSNLPRVTKVHTGNLTRELFNNKINHNLMGAEKSKDQLARLFNIY